VRRRPAVDSAVDETLQGALVFGRERRSARAAQTLGDCSAIC